MDFSTFFQYPDSAGSAESKELVFLPDCNEADLAKLLAYTETVRFRAGDVVMRLGEADRSLYIVTGGRFEVFVPDARGRQAKALATIEEGSVIGEVAFFDARPRSASVRAVTDGEMLRLSFEMFEVLAAKEAALGRAILLDLGRILARRLRQTNALAAEWVS